MAKRLCSAFILMMLLSGCASAAVPSDPEAHVVILWHPFTDARKEALEALSDRFNTENQDALTLILEYQSDIYGKITSATPEQWPDLIIISPEDLASYDEAGVAVPLPEGGEAMQDLLPIARALYTTGNTLQAIPLGLTTYVLYYNQDWLRDLEYDPGSATLEQLRQAACAATSAEGKQTGLGISTYPGTFLVFLTAGGFTPTQAEPNDGTLVQTTTLLQELLGASCAEIYEISDEGSAQFSNGTMAMILDSSLRYHAIEQAIAVEHNFSPGVTSLPGTGAQPASTLWHGPGMMLLSPEGSRRERAQQVLQWFLEADVQVAWSQSTGYLPVRRSVVERQVQGVGLSTIEKDLFYLLLRAANEGTWITWPESMNSATCRPALVRGLIDLSSMKPITEVVSSTLSTCRSTSTP